jgi:hypothetical protein
METVRNVALQAAAPAGRAIIAAVFLVAQGMLLVEHVVTSLRETER